MRYATLLDAACAMFRAGHSWNADYQRFERGSWYAYLATQKNGACRVRSA